MQEKIVQIITSVLNIDQLSIHGLSETGVLYQLINGEDNKPLWVKIAESPITK